MPPWSDEALAQLERWGLTTEDAEANGLFFAADASQIYPDFKRGEPCIVIPYYWPDGTPQTFTRDNEEFEFCRIRYLSAPRKAGFTQVKEQRYSQPGRSGIHVYYPVREDRWETLLRDPEEPIVITEGEAKALVAAREGIPCIALGGVYNFALSSGEGLTEGLALIKANGKDIFLCFDSDRATNNAIRTAEARLVQELQSNRGAHCNLIMLPPDGDKKVGLDDFLNKHGIDAFMLLLKGAINLGVMDARVIALNKDVAIVEKEGMVYDLHTREFVTRDFFVNGSTYSSLEHFMQGGQKRTEPKRVSVARTYLTSQYAQRYKSILFRPGEGTIVMDDNGNPAMNMWQGWNAERGLTAKDKRVAAWLELTAFLCSNMQPEDRDVLVKLFAYKAQNPMRKVPLCPVFIGKEGCGKSLWAECISAAFAPYSYALSSVAFGSEFNAWIEHNIIAVVNEADAKHMREYDTRIKSLISDIDQPMRDLYRTGRKVQCYASFIMSANDPAVGSYSQDNRRMIVVGCPDPMTNEHGLALYQYLGKERGDWVNNGGPAALMGYLLDYDLGDWQPPKRVDTAEKDYAMREGLTPVQELARQMRECKDDEQIREWLTNALSWATENVNSSNSNWAIAARTTLEGLKNLRISPWYEVKDLALIFPYLSVEVLGAKYDRTAAPGKISRELRNAGVKLLRSRDDIRGFRWRGQWRQYLLLCGDVEDFKNGLTQADFERWMDAFKPFGIAQRRQQ